MKNSNQIVLTHTIYGWIYTKSDDVDRYGNHKTYNTYYTRHTQGHIVERTMKDEYPDYTIYVQERIRPLDTQQL